MLTLVRRRIATSFRMITSQHRLSRSTQTRLQINSIIVNGANHRCLRDRLHQLSSSDRDECPVLTRILPFGASSSALSSRTTFAIPAKNSGSVVGRLRNQGVVAGLAGTPGNASGNLVTSAGSASLPSASCTQTDTMSYRRLPSIATKDSGRRSCARRPARRYL